MDSENLDFPNKISKFKSEKVIFLGDSALVKWHFCGIKNYNYKIQFKFDTVGILLYI